MGKPNDEVPVINEPAVEEARDSSIKLQINGLTEKELATAEKEWQSEGAVKGDDGIWVVDQRKLEQKWREEQEEEIERLMNAGFMGVEKEEEPE